jgi:hypothetical protein
VPVEPLPPDTVNKVVLDVVGLYVLATLSTKTFISADPSKKTNGTAKEVWVTPSLTE